MRKNVLLFCLTFCLLSLTACGNKSLVKPNDEIHKIDKVKEISKLDKESVKDSEILETEEVTVEEAPLEEPSEIYDVMEIEENRIYGNVLAVEEDCLLVYTYLGLSYLNLDEAVNYSVDDYISFTSDGMVCLSYPVQMNAYNVEKATSLEFMDYLSNEIDFKNTYLEPYIDENSGYVVYESEIVDVLESDSEIVYLASTNEGLIYFTMGDYIIYNVGDFVDFYTDGLVLDSYPAQINNVYDSILIDVD